MQRKRNNGGHSEYIVEEQRRRRRNRKERGWRRTESGPCEVLRLGRPEDGSTKDQKGEKQMIDFQNMRFSVCTQTQQPVNEVRENQQ